MHLLTVWSLHADSSSSNVLHCYLWHAVNIITQEAMKMSYMKHIIDQSGISEG